MKAKFKLREFITAGKEPAPENAEKEKRAEELIIANKELAVINEEREKRALELIIANKELALQNREKENREAELILANKELALKNREKENISAELILANKELAFQNKEKEKRVEDLSITNNKLKIAEKQLYDTNKELEGFSYSVSHDLRAPLRAVTGFAQMLKEDYQTKLDEEANRIINVIVHNAKIMGQLIDDLLRFSKMSRLEAINESIDMKKMAENCVAELLQTEKQTMYAITIHNMPESKGDESMLKQVWSNLIDNALKYSAQVPSPEIEAGAIENDKVNTYYVKDNGAGFDMKYADKLFGVFQRLHRQDEYEGTGLGLALVKRIIDKHGGEIWAESALGKGATFYFSIPKTLQT